MSKYHAKRTAGPNGKIYASKKEATRAWELHMMQNAGWISGLREQVPFDLLAKDISCGYRQPLRYVADFVYWKKEGVRIVEDAKGFCTPAYLLKKRLMRQLLGITITEV